MKKLISFIICIAVLLLAVGCAEEKYPEVESTEEEARVMMTFELGDEKYEMKYELYRALFLNFSDYYDNGDKTFWTLEESADELKLLNDKILEYTLDIFATLHIAKTVVDFDPYSDEVEQTIAEYIEKSVEGDGDTVTGFGGNYDAYLDSLKAANMNYSVQKLLYRYSIAYDKVIKHYEGVVNENNPAENEEGSIDATNADVLAFYNSDLSVRVTPVVINAKYTKLERAIEIRNEIAACSTTDEAINAAIRNTASIANDVIEGVVIGTCTLDEAYYKEVTDTAFALGYQETSNVITVVTDTGAEYWILYKRDKNTEHFEKNYAYMESVYVSQKIGEIIKNTKTQLKNSLKESDTYKNLNHSDISMK